MCIRSKEAPVCVCVHYLVSTYAEIYTERRLDMTDADPEMLLEWLTLGQGEESRDIQMVALEQLCMLLLMADNVDKCFES